MVKQWYNSIKARLRNVHKSWTIRWAALLAVVCEYGQDILDFMPSVSQYIDTNEYNKWMLRLAIIIFIINRMKTKTCLSEK